jgi:pimeloyl-ACP methyl ester carboxylesterase
MVITNAAVGDSEVSPGVRGRVHPGPGHTLASLSSTKPGSCLGGTPTDVFNFVPYPGGPPGDVDTYIKPSLVPSCFASGLPASQAAVIAATQRPLADSTLQEASGVPAWKTIPSWAVIGTADRVLRPAEQTFMAKGADARITDVNAGHLSMIADPETVAQVIEQAAQATS